MGGTVRLETGRLILREPSVADAAIRRELWSERDPRVPPHRRIDSDGKPTIADIEDSIRHERRSGSLRLLTVKLRESGEMIGYCGLVANAYGQEGEPEIAFELLRRHWGRGYATEAAEAVIGWAKNAGYQRLWATLRDWNVPSRRVLAKLGFTETARVDPDPAHGDSLFTARDI